MTDTESQQQRRDLRLTAIYSLFDHKIKHDILKEIKTQLVKKKTVKINWYKMSVEWTG
jgi:hypothetical protein